MSDSVLSADTEVVLLLCGRFGGERQEAFPPLPTRDYKELAKWLNDRGLRPADLLTDTGREALSEVHQAKLERKRVEFLLGRGTAMALALERWNRGGLWVISRGDAEFPKRLRRHLKHMTPPLLYGAGNKDLLDMGGLAIIGSRDATPGALDFTRDIASQCAREHIGVVSGGARGVDAAAMQGATESGGCTIGVLANDLLKASVNRQNRMGLQEGRLVLVSPFYPEAGFNAGNAMARNKYIYALADRALVIDSALGSGGTWEGALETLRQKWVPLYVRTPGHGPGNMVLVEKGGIPFTYQAGNSQSLTEIFSSIEEASSVQESFPESTQPSLLEVELVPPVLERTPEQAPELVQELLANEVTANDLGATATTSLPVEPTDLVEGPVVEGPQVSAMAVSLDIYPEFVKKLLLALASDALTDEQIADTLGLEKSQAKVWLKRAHEEGRVEKLKKPVRYALGVQTSFLA